MPCMHDIGEAAHLWLAQAGQDGPEVRGWQHATGRARGPRSRRPACARPTMARDRAPRVRPGYTSRCRGGVVLGKRPYRSYGYACASLPASVSATVPYPYPSSTHPHRATQAPEVLLLGGGGEAGTAYYVVDAHAGRLALQGRLDMHVAQVRAHLPMRRMGLALLVSGGADAPVVAGRGAASAAAQTPRAEQRADLPLGPARVCLSPAYPCRSWSCRRRCMRAARSSAQTCCFAPLGFVLALRTLAGHGAAGAAARAPRGAARVPAAQPH